MGTAIYRSSVAPKMAAITPGASALSPRPRAIYIDTSGTIDITNEDGTTCNGVNVVAGTVIPLSPWKITAASGAVVKALID